MGKKVFKNNLKKLTTFMLALSTIVSPTASAVWFVVREGTGMVVLERSLEATNESPEDAAKRHLREGVFVVAVRDNTGNVRYYFNEEDEE